MRDLTARRLRTLVHLMAERGEHRPPCRPGTLLEEVITAVPRTPGNRDEAGPELFQELIQATNSMADTGLLTKDDAGWSLTASGLTAASSPSRLRAALHGADAGSLTGAPATSVQQPFPSAREAPDPPGRTPRSVGLAGGFRPSATSVGTAGHHSWTAAQRRPWAADDPALELSYDGAADVWCGTLTLHPGHYEYKVVIDRSWRENYGVRGMRSGPNFTLDVPVARDVTFIFDHLTKVLVLG
jgi:hypothetical protein